MNDMTKSEPSITELTLPQIMSNVLYWAKLLLKKWWIIATLGMLGSVLGIFWAASQKAKYQSRLTFALEESGGGLTGVLSFASDFGFNLGGSNKNIFSGDNIMNILTSRLMIEESLLSADTINGKVTSLADEYLYLTGMQKEYTNHKRIGTIRFPLNQERNQFSYHQDSVMFLMYDRIVKKELKVSKPDKKLNFYEVRFTSFNERFSKVFTSRLVISAMRYYTEMRVKRSRETVDILESRVASMRGNAKAAIQGAASIRDANINPAFASQGAALQKTQLDVGAYSTAYSELFKTLELARYEYLREIPLLQIIDDAKYPLKMIKTGRLYAGIIGGIIGGVIAILGIWFVNSAQRIRRWSGSHLN
jgi:hypothetical protein